MSTLTIAIDEHLLRAARVKALRRGISVNEMCCEAITAYAIGEDAAEVPRASAGADALWATSDGIQTRPRPVDPPSREDLYEEMLAQKSVPVSE